MRVEIDEDRCKGHGTCWALSPEVFELTDDGYAVTLVDPVPAEFEGSADEAVRNCPERAITAS